LRNISNEVEGGGQHAYSKLRTDRGEAMAITPPRLYCVREKIVENVVVKYLHVFAREVAWKLVRARRVRVVDIRRKHSALCAATDTYTANNSPFGKTKSHNVCRIAFAALPKSRKQTASDR
jgi:hypothetical protein